MTILDSETVERLATEAENIAYRASGYHSITEVITAAGSSLSAAIFSVLVEQERDKKQSFFIPPELDNAAHRPGRSL